MMPPQIPSTGVGDSGNFMHARQKYDIMNFVDFVRA